MKVVSLRLASLGPMHVLVAHSTGFPRTDAGLRRLVLARGATSDTVESRAVDIVVDRQLYAYGALPQVALLCWYSSLAESEPRNAILCIVVYFETWAGH